MPELYLITDPEAKILKTPTKEISIDDMTKVVSSKMIEIMKESQGIGLAAPQVGLSWKLFVMYIPDEMTSPQIFVNPKISYSSGSEIREESCLSIPGITRNIKRHTNIFVEALDINGNRIAKRYEDLQARCIQHEIDHLNGKLITDY